MRKKRRKTPGEMKEPNDPEGLMFEVKDKKKKKKDIDCNIPWEVALSIVLQETALVLRMLRKEYEAERKVINNRIKDNMPEAIDGVRVVKTSTTDGFRFILADNTWLLIRFSGTEPVLRIYTESDSPTRVERLLKMGKELAGI